MAGTVWENQFPVMRTLLSGAGCPIWEKADHVPSHDKAIPRNWYGYDEDTPLIFEPEVDYLKRFNLLLPGEKASKQDPVSCTYKKDSMGVFYLQNNI
jgi:hypothetical protein